MCTGHSLETADVLNNVSTVCLREALAPNGTNCSRVTISATTIRCFPMTVPTFPTNSAHNLRRTGLHYIPTIPSRHVTSVPEVARILIQSAAYARDAELHKRGTQNIKTDTARSSTRGAKVVPIRKWTHYQQRRWLPARTLVSVAEQRRTLTARREDCAIQQETFSQNPVVVRSSAPPNEHGSPSRGELRLAK